MSTNKNELENNGFASEEIKETDSERRLSKLMFDLLGSKDLRRYRLQNGSSYLVCRPGWMVLAAQCDKIDHAALKNQWWHAAAQVRGMVYDCCEKIYLTVPVLFYRRGRYGWRAIWPLHLAASMRYGTSSIYEDTVEGSPDAWAKLMRMTLAEQVCPITRSLREQLTDQFYSWGRNEDDDEDEDEDEDDDDPK
jgi:hypothetical protein